MARRARARAAVGHRSQVAATARAGIAAVAGLTLAVLAGATAVRTVADQAMAESAASDRAVAAPVTRVANDGGRLRVDLVVEGRTVGLTLPPHVELTSAALVVRVGDDGSIVPDGLAPPSWPARGLQVGGALLAAIGAVLTCTITLRRRRHGGTPAPRCRRRTRSRVIALVAGGWLLWTTGRILDEGVGAWWGGTSGIAGRIMAQVGLVVVAAGCFVAGAVIATWAHHNHATLPRPVASASAAVTAASRVIPEPAVFADLLKGTTEDPSPRRPVVGTMAAAPAASDR